MPIGPNDYEPICHEINNTELVPKKTGKNRVCASESSQIDIDNYSPDILSGDLL
jgi:hypothetical protein